MADSSLITETKALIAQSFDLDLSQDPISEEDLFEFIADQIAHVFETNPELVFSMLYRLDVDESQVETVLRPDAPLPANIGLAHLVLDRQKARLQTKKSYKQDPIEGWEEW